MSRSKQTNLEPEKAEPKKAALPVKYPTSALLKSKALSGYQQDFVRAVLTESEYTIEEATALLDNAMKEEA